MVSGLKPRVRVKCFGMKSCFVKVDESNLFVWQGLLVPDSAPYNKVTIS